MLAPGIADVAPASLLRYASAHEPYDLWSLQCESDKVQPVTAFDVERPPKQHSLRALVHTKMQKERTIHSRRLQVYRASMSLSEANAWILCQPTKALSTCIPRRKFRMWLQLYCQVPLFAPGAGCRRPGATLLWIYLEINFCIVTTDLTEYGDTTPSSTSSFRFRKSCPTSYYRATPGIHS